MKNKKLKNVIYISITIIILLIIIEISIILKNKTPNLDYIYTYAGDKYNGLPIHYTTASYAYIYGTPDEAIECTDYTFIGRVDSIDRTEYRNPVEVETVADGSQKMTLYNPYTIYNVTVIENIKGDLIKTRLIEVEQFGGLDKSGKTYTFEESKGLLNIGECYIMSVYASNTANTLRISDASPLVSLGRIDEPNTINEIKSILSTKNEVATEDAMKNALTNKITDTEIIEKITEYKKAALNPKVPLLMPNNRIKVKSKLYDIEYNK